MAGYISIREWAMSLFMTLGWSHSLLFPFALTLLGLGLVGAGVWWQKREERIRLRLRAVLPPSLRDAIESAD